MDASNETPILISLKISISGIVNTSESEKTRTESDRKYLER